jgi:transposase
MIKEIQRRYLTKRYSRPILKDLKLIAIDEISIGKGHNYLTVVLDLISGAVVFVGNGKGADALVPFWKRLKSSRARIQAVAIDMSPAYISAVSENLPKATIVFDHFHLIKLFNEKLSDLRRDLHQGKFTLPWCLLFRQAILSGIVLTLKAYQTFIIGSANL